MLNHSRPGAAHFRETAEHKETARKPWEALVPIAPCPGPALCRESRKPTVRIRERHYGFGEFLRHGGNNLEINSWVTNPRDEPWRTPSIDDLRAWWTAIWSDRVTSALWVRNQKIVGWLSLSLGHWECGVASSWFLAHSSANGWKSTCSGCYAPGACLGGRHLLKDWFFMTKLDSFLIRRSQLPSKTSRIMFAIRWTCHRLSLYCCLWPKLMLKPFDIGTILFACSWTFTLVYTIRF